MNDLASIVVKKVSELQKYKDNPRFITKGRYEKLKAEIRQHGFKDILKLADDEKTVLNGNHRLPILEELHIEEVNCINTGAATPAEMFKVAIASNQDYAEYDRDALTELIYKLDIPIQELEPFEVDLGKDTPILELLNQVGPPLFDDGKEPKEHKPRTVVCPECSACFEV